MTNAPNVLLLDQDDLLRKATALLLSHRGAGVSPAATLEEAISLSQERVHDVALIDLSPSMPNARELLRRLQREGLLPQRIVLSTSEPPSDVEAGSFSEILIKPYPFDQLLAAIFGQARAAVRARPTQGWGLPWRRRLGGRARLAGRGGGAGRRGGRAGRERGGRGPSERALRSARRAARGRPHPG